MSNGRYKVTSTHEWLGKGLRTTISYHDTQIATVAIKEHIVKFDVVFVHHLTAIYEQIVDGVVTERGERISYAIANVELQECI